MCWFLGEYRTLMVVLVVSVAIARALGRRSCNTAHYGLQKGREVHIQDQHLSPFEPNWRITVPAVCNRVVGISVTACDINGAPSVFLSSLTRGLIMRSSQITPGAYLYVTAYCDPAEDEILVQRSPMFRQPNMPHKNQWRQSNPISIDDLYVLSPPTPWPEDSPDFITSLANEPVVLGTGPYPIQNPNSLSRTNPMPVNSNAKPGQTVPMQRPDVGRETVAPKNSSSSNITTSMHQPHQLGVDSSGEASENTATSEEAGQPQNTDPESEGKESDTRSYNPITLLKQLAQWWLKRFRQWTGKEPANRRGLMLKEDDSHDYYPWWSNSAAYPEYAERIMDHHRM